MAQTLPKIMIFRWAQSWKYSLFKSCPNIKHVPLNGGCHTKMVGPNPFFWPWDLLHIVTFKSTVVLLNVPPVRTRGTFSKTIVYFFENPIPGKTCCIQICNQAKQFFYTRNLYKQSSLYTRETFQTNQLLHTRNLSNKAVFTHSKPFKQSSFQTQQTFKQSRF